MDRRTISVAVVCLALGYLAANAAAPNPEPDRPVLRWVAKAAKNLLWLALLAEPPPAEPQPDHQVVRSTRVGEDGYPLVDNGRGW